MHIMKSNGMFFYTIELVFWIQERMLEYQKCPTEEHSGGGLYNRQGRYN